MALPDAFGSVQRGLLAVVRHTDSPKLCFPGKGRGKKAPYPHGCDGAWLRQRWDAKREPERGSSILAAVHRSVGTWMRAHVYFVCFSRQILLFGRMGFFLSVGQLSAGDAPRNHGPFSCRDNQGVPICSALSLAIPPGNIRDATCNASLQTTSRCGCPASRRAGRVFSAKWGSTSKRVKQNQQIPCPSLVAGAEMFRLRLCCSSVEEAGTQGTSLRNT